MQNNNNQKPSKLRAFLSSDTFKGLLPVIGLVVIVIVMNILTQGKILTAKRLRLLLSQVYYPMIVATGVFFVMTLGSIDFTEGSTLGLASIVISKLSFYSIPLAIVGGILTGAAIGAINGFFHVKFKLQSFIITICTMYLFRGVCAYMTTESAVPASAAIKALDLNWLKITITVAVLLIFLYRKAVSPAAKMQKAVLEYTGDKDSAKIVGKMYRIRVKNELGYLSDAISDLALEIDHYTRENIRIAGERERAEKELFSARSGNKKLFLLSPARFSARLKTPPGARSAGR